MHVLINRQDQWWRASRQLLGRRRKLTQLNFVVPSCVPSFFSDQVCLQHTAQDSVGQRLPSCPGLSRPPLGLQIEAGPSAKPLPVLVGPGLLSLSPHLGLYVCIPFLLNPILRQISFLSGTSSFIPRYPFSITIVLQHCLKNRHAYTRKHPLFLCVNRQLYSSV